MTRFFSSTPSGKTFIALLAGIACVSVIVGITVAGVLRNSPKPTELSKRTIASTQIQGLYEQKRGFALTTILTSQDGSISTVELYAPTEAQVTALLPAVGSYYVAKWYEPAPHTERTTKQIKFVRLTNKYVDNTCTYQVIATDNSVTTLSVVKFEPKVGEPLYADWTLPANTYDTDTRS